MHPCNQRLVDPNLLRAPTWIFYVHGRPLPRRTRVRRRLQAATSFVRRGGGLSRGRELRLRLARHGFEVRLLKGIERDARGARVSDEATARSKRTNTNGRGVALTSEGLASSSSEVSLMRLREVQEKCATDG